MSVEENEINTIEMSVEVEYAMETCEIVEILTAEVVEVTVKTQIQKEVEVEIKIAVLKGVSKLQLKC